MLSDILAFSKELSQTLHTLLVDNTTSCSCCVFDHDLRLLLLLGLLCPTLERFNFEMASATLMALFYITRHG